MYKLHKCVGYQKLWPGGRGGLGGMGGGGAFKNTYELLNLRALKFSYKISFPYIERCEFYSHLSMYGKDILYAISKVPFEVPHKMSYPYIERY